jgi:hypothetical protein
LASDAADTNKNSDEAGGPAGPEASNDKSTDSAPTQIGADLAQTTQATTPEKVAAEPEPTENPIPVPASSDVSTPPPIPEKDSTTTKQSTSTSEEASVLAPPNNNNVVTEAQKNTDANKVDETAVSKGTEESATAHGNTAEPVEEVVKETHVTPQLDGDSETSVEGSATTPSGEGKSDAVVKPALRLGLDHIREASTASTMSSSGPGTPDEEEDEVETPQTGGGGSASAKNRRNAKRKKAKKAKKAAQADKSVPPPSELKSNAVDKPTVQKPQAETISATPVDAPGDEGSSDGVLVDADAEETKATPTAPVDVSGEGLDSDGVLVELKGESSGEDPVVVGDEPATSAAIPAKPKAAESSSEDGWEPE